MENLFKCIKKSNWRAVYLFPVFAMLFIQCAGQTKNETKMKNPYYDTKATGKITVDNKKLKEILPSDVYHIAREKGTERPFTSEYNKFDKVGEYHCVVCGNLLFRSNGKFASSCGWPSFFEPATKDAMIYLDDNTHGMQRIEVQCGRCETHLGHIFNDGPPPTGKRYCINGKVIKFEDEKENK